MPCTKCSLIEGNTHNAQIYGNLKSKLLIVRNYPPAGETRSKFINSKQNKFLIKYLKSFGFNEDEYCITSIIRCYPNNVSITNEHITTCSTTFKTLVAEMKPSIILGFGSIPVHLFIPQYDAVPIFSIAGKVFDFDTFIYIQNYAIGHIINEKVAMNTSNAIMETLLNEYRIKININK